MVVAHDNPVWLSLTTRQHAIAQGDGDARRYAPDVAPFVAIERDTPAARAAALALVAPGEEVCFIGVGPGDLHGWTLLARDSIVQMHWDGRTRVDAQAFDVVELGAADAPDMLALTQRVFPGYFRARTVELGRYLGVRAGGELVAMAGERLRATGYCEVSGVCTHPAHAGRGLAAALSTVVTLGIAARGERPYLHAGSGNVRARALYQRLGFELAAELPLWHLRRTS
jgi:ribosomal protein S18 acetylase RimI-like enzyme